MLQKTSDEVSSNIYCGFEAVLLSFLFGVQEEGDAGGADPELLDPVSDLKVSNFELVGALRERQALLQRRAAMPCHRYALHQHTTHCRACEHESPFLLNTVKVTLFHHSGGVNTDYMTKRPREDSAQHSARRRLRSCPVNYLLLLWRWSAWGAAQGAGLGGDVRRSAQ